MCEIEMVNNEELRQKIHDEKLKGISVKSIHFINFCEKITPPKKQI